MDTKIVGERISEGRKNKGLSQAQFAELVNISPQAVGKWERSESLPDIFMLGRIGEVIGTTDINYFLGKTPCSCNFCECCQTRCKNEH
ncbi:MAG: helix-turn-helix domain-containing protein [Firmicutes bacterium]|nr:helix-turn-helix domain-containing protein [Bacillota bacterium]